MLKIRIILQYAVGIASRLYIILHLSDINAGQGCAVWKRQRRMCTK
jgi:hypothetical protein